MNKDEELAEVVNSFFALVFKTKISYSPDTQSPELEDGDEIGSRMKPP